MKLDSDHTCQHLVSRRRLETPDILHQDIFQSLDLRQELENVEEGLGSGVLHVLLQALSCERLAGRAHHDGIDAPTIQLLGCQATNVSTEK